MSGTTRTNSGTIAVGITLPGDYTLTNTATGVITNAGVAVAGAPASTANTVVNDGSISGTTAGISLGSGGVVSNAGTVSGTDGVMIVGATATVANTGTIDGAGGRGVYLGLGGTVANAAYGTITGDGGVDIAGAAGTVTNAGIIGGTGKYAVRFGAGFANRMIIVPGATFIGNVNGANKSASAAVSTLELAVGATAGTFSGLGTQFTNFGSMVVDAGATWSLASAAALTVYGTVVNTGTITDTVTLGASGTLTNAPMAEITVATAGAIVSTAANVSIINAGRIGVGDVAGPVAAISLAMGGQVTNLRDSQTIGGYSGIVIQGGAGTVINDGEIRGYGTGGIGVGLRSGGLVINRGGIAAATGILSENGIGTVVNSGVVSRFAFGTGVKLAGGGSVTNTSGGFISGTDAGVWISGQRGTVINAGQINTEFSTLTAFGIYLGRGGEVTNATSAFIYGGVGIFAAGERTTVTNAGFLGLGYTQQAVSLAAGGQITNLSSALMEGFAGIAVSGGAGTVDNAGRIITVPPFGMTSAGRGAILLEAGGTLVNRRAGSITSMYDVVRIDGDAFVDNAGTIQSAYGTGVGVLVANGSLVTNQTFGTISGTVGVRFTSAAGTLSNAGTISGNSGTAVSFGAFDGNRAIVGPGAVFAGKVDGGNTIGSAFVSTLELASGATTGTVAGLNTQYIGFGQITIDAGAAWAFDTGSTLVADQTLTNSGSLIAPLTLGSNSRVINDVAGTVSGSGPVGLAGGTSAPGITIRNQGLITTASKLGAGSTAGSRAILLQAGGIVTNDAGGTIAADVAIEIAGQAGTITNAGMLQGAGDSGNGVRLNAGGSVTNLSGGRIVGGFGVYGTGLVVDNAGTIGSGATDSVGVSITGGSITNHAGGTITGGASAMHLVGSDGQVLNQGLIQAVGTSAASSGIVIGTNGRITNAAGGTIAGAGGVRFGGADAVLDNAGLITGTGTGAALDAGGIIVNHAAGTISGSIGIRFGSALPSSPISGTVANAGTVQGTGGYAVRFDNADGNRVVITPGALFDGKVDGGNAIGSVQVSTLELASAGRAGTISSLGTQFLNFGQVVIDVGAAWVMTGANSLQAGATIINTGSLSLTSATLAGGADLLNNGFVLIDPSTVELDDLGGTGTVTIDADSTLTVAGTVASTETIGFATISGTLSLGTPTAMLGLLQGFDVGTFIDLPDVMVAESGSILAGNTLHVVIAGGSTFDVRLDPTHDYQFQTVVVSGDRITMSPPCFREGTRIRTVRGDVAVEALRVGDRVITAGPDAGEQKIVWVGHRIVDCAEHPKPALVWPVRILAGAFANGIPAEDLWLSPDHAVYVDNVLIPVKHLVNGRSVVQEPVDRVSYYHVETPRHDVLLAEGLACETYLDAGNRANFDNGGDVIRLHPDFAMRMWEASGCAPLQVTGPILAAVRERLRARAQRVLLILPS